MLRIAALIAIPLRLVFICNLTLAGDATSRIIDGTNTPATNFPAVARMDILRNNGDPIRGTGTLLGSRYVITAAHVMTNSFGAEDWTSSSRVVINNIPYEILTVSIHPSYIIFFGDIERQFDVAIVTLSTEVLGVKPFPYFTGMEQVNTTIGIVGYGTQGNVFLGADGTFPADGTVNYGSTILEEVTETFLKWTVDLGEATIAPGDSGGPALILVDGVLHLSGIISGGSSATNFGLGGTAICVRVSAISDWIQSIIDPSGTIIGFAGKARGTTLLATIPKAKLSLSFSKPEADSLDLVFQASDLKLDVVNTEASIFVGTKLIEKMIVLGKSTRGSGKLLINTKKGEAKYSLRKASIQSQLALYGLTNADSQKQVQPLFFIGFNSVYYGAKVPMFYNCRLNKIGRAKL